MTTIVHLLTFCSDPNKAHLLESTLSRQPDFIKHKIRFHPIVVDQSQYVGFVSKIYETRKYIINAGFKPDDVLCFVDAYDVIVNHANHLLKKFLQFHTDLVIGAELNSYPEGYDHRYPPSPTNYKYVNSGGYIGYAKAILNVLTWKPDEEIRAMCEGGGDQRYFIEYYLFHCGFAKIKLDHYQLIFQNMYKTDWSEFRILMVDGTKPLCLNVATNTAPAFLHFNGESFYGTERATGRPVNMMEIYADPNLAHSAEMISVGDKYTIESGHNWGSIPGIPK